jgi:2,4-dienoyl-CoA reductase-like NADH-dependent reductase (Old Yellow Enzyme family)
MQRFHYHTSEELKQEITNLEVNIPYTEDLSILKSPVKINKCLSQNSFAILPMEGCDSNLDGSPSDLVIRRYKRFSEGGAGFIWGEANAITPEGKANERQMMITDDNLEAFKSFIAQTKKTGLKANGYTPLIISQLTHSGRYSRPFGHKPAPLVPQHDPILDPITGVTSDDQIVTDEYLDSLIPKYVHSAILAKKAGYDGIDVKACHRYLLSELLASYTRKGKYGGNFKNRTRLILTIIKEIRKATGDDFIIACRFNVFDAHPYPYGFGCYKKNMWKFNKKEPVKLIQKMIKNGVNLLSNSAGNPYYLYPQVTRPFDTSSLGIPEPKENQLVSIERLFNFTETVQKAAKDIPVIGNGYSYLRQYITNVGAANIEKGRVKMIGLGRCAFAYPDAPKEALTKGAIDPKKCCICCSKCTQIMRDHGMTGCVVRDNEIYGPLAKKYTNERIEREGK